jgi:hypothetical protein
LELLKHDSDLILYASRVKLITEVETAVKLLFTKYNGGNRKNNLIVGLPSIGKVI